MHFKTLKHELKDGVFWITMNRPDFMNAMNAMMYKELVQAFDEAEKDSEVRVIVLSGEGRAFSAGADVLDFAVTRRGIVEMYDYIKATLDALDKVEQCSKPVIAAVNGLAYGGGLEFTLLCDVVIASEAARFGLPEGMLGILPGTAVSKIQRVLPKHKALELMLTGEPIDAKEAERIGLVNKTVPDDELEKAVTEMAEKMKRVGPISHKYIKEIWRAAPQDYDYWYTMMPQLFDTEDAKEGQKAFLERRKAVWKGK
ncbi:MAG: enoyl-CoA hydratase/isomerase family protein [Candidatus Lokiarchaeia archaeon]